MVGVHDRHGGIRYGLAITALPHFPMPSSTAVVTMELQRGVVGDLSTMNELTQVVNNGNVLQVCGEVCQAARLVDIPVIHAQAAWRSDRRGTHLTSPIEQYLAKNPDQILEGTQAVDPIPELGDTSTDLFSVRSHGMSPWIGTTLDAIIRSLNVDTIVAIGVSLNVGLFGLCLNAVDLGYRVVVPVDATAGVPAEYADAVIKHSLSALATLTTSRELIQFWTTTQ